MSRVGVDIGGTFTDFVAVKRTGLEVRKTLSTPDEPSQALWTLVDEYGEPVSMLVHGTTIATNALLERRGAKVVLCTTAGFEDVLWLRRQDRADLYDLAALHPAPVLDREDVVGVDERMGPEGVVRPLQPEEIDRVVGEVGRRHPGAVAVSFLFSFRHAEHESALLRALAERFPQVPIVASSDVVPLFREYERTSTATAEAYLRPTIGRYVSELESEGPSHGVNAVRVMASGGGTLRPQRAGAAATALALSGPAGGVVGAQAVVRAVGLDDVLTIDMGGTSADASLLLGGEPLRETSGTVGGVPLLLSTISIDTVSAGGGSIAWVDAGGALKVGPRSAGAKPGPACYGRGGEDATVTDALTVLGWLDAAHPLAADVAIDANLARRAVARVAADARLGVDEAAWGILSIASTTMARSLKHVSVRRGIDPRGMALLPFGGAGPLFGCLLAEELGIRTVVVPLHPGVLSALGLAVAPERVEAAMSMHQPLLTMHADTLAAWRRDLETRVADELPRGNVTLWADCRYAGQGYEVTVPVVGTPAELMEEFGRAHRARFGHGDPSRPVELVVLRAVGEEAAAVFEVSAAAVRADDVRTVQIGWRREWIPATRRTLEGLETGLTIDGPALFGGVDATAFVAPGWRATVHESGALLARRA